MAKITPFGGVRVTLFPGLSFTLRSANIGKLLGSTPTKPPKKRGQQLELPGVTPTKKRR